MRQEFGEVEIDLKAHELAVTTETIELEGVVLGEFQIRLTWTEIGHGSQPYRVVALDPHPAARRDDVTHPHVQDERLCEGEGRSAIAAALAEGRLYEFFLLVDQLLHNYGRGSGFVEMDDWEGVPCSDCGASAKRRRPLLLPRLRFDPLRILLALLPGLRRTRSAPAACGQCAVLRLRLLLQLPGLLHGLPQTLLRKLPRRQHVQVLLRRTLSRGTSR